LAGNTAEDGTQCLGEVTSGGHNLYTDLTGCTWATSAGDVGVADAKLGELGSHGGPTQTIPLQSGSSAIGLAPVAVCDGLTVDQRGVKRPQGPKCDAGAYERT
jgi:hypothetical protein